MKKSVNEYENYGLPLTSARPPTLKMKRFEAFNQAFKTNETAEMQATGMIISEIIDRYEIEDAFDWWREKYKAQVKWLNEKVK